MERKLVKSGHSSLVIAIPSDWIRQNKLQAGDRVTITEEQDNLIIRKEDVKEITEKKKKVINIDGKDKWEIIHMVTQAYIDNFFYIVIKGNDLSKKSSDVKQIISDLVALELIDESSQQITARNFLDLNDVEVGALLRRIDNIVRSMLIDTIAAIKDASKDLVQTVINRDKEVNRLTFLIFKILKASYLDPGVFRTMQFDKLQILKYWETAQHLEKFGDRIKNIADIGIGLSKKHKVHVLELLQKILSLQKDSMKAFYTNSIALANQVFKERYELVEQIKKFIKEKDCAICSQIAVNAFNMSTNINDISRVVLYLENN